MNAIKIPKSTLLPAALIGAVSSSSNYKYVAAVCFVFILGNTYLLLRNRFDNFLSVAVFFQITIVQSSALYVFGQYVFVGTTLFVSSFAYFSMLCSYFLLSRFIETERSVQIKLSMFMPVILMKLVYALPLWQVVQFLGFGYDNYGHVNVIRKILVDRKFFFNDSNPISIPSFASNTPMGGHALVSFIGQVVGVNGIDYVDFLKFYLFAFALLVSAFIWIAFSIAKLKIKAFWFKALTSVFLVAVLFYTYLSHIWFSGYFASNVSTVLILIGIAVLISDATLAHKSIVLISLIGTSAYIYPLYAVFICALSVVFLYSKRKGILDQISLSGTKWKHCAILITVYFTLIAVLSILSMMNGYGSGQFLASGGIEPIPIGTAMFIFGLSLVLLDGKGVFGAELKIASHAVIAMNFIAIIGMLYAFIKLAVPGERWFVPYYPTKVAISALVVTVVFFVRYLFEFEQKSHKILNILDVKKIAVLCALATLFIVSTQKWPFAGGYMGSTSGVVESIRNAQSEVVDGKVVSALVEIAHQSQKPVLYLSDIHESELNTRWINSLQFKWNDINWADWMNARSFIEDKDYSEASRILNNRFVVVVDRYSNYDSNSQSFDLFTNLCLLKTNELLECR
jgi:hypothetical protein